VGCSVVSVAASVAGSGERRGGQGWWVCASARGCMGASSRHSGRRSDPLEVVAGVVIETYRIFVSVPVDRSVCKPYSAPGFAELLEGGHPVGLCVARTLLVLVVVVLVVPKVVEVVEVARRLKLSMIVPRCGFPCCGLRCCSLHLAGVV